MPNIDFSEWPGPPVQPVIYDGSFPPFASEGDVYISSVLGSDGYYPSYQFLRGDWREITTTARNWYLTGGVDDPWSTDASN